MFHESVEIADALRRNEHDQNEQTLTKASVTQCSFLYLSYAKIVTTIETEKYSIGPDN